MGGDHDHLSSIQLYAHGYVARKLGVTFESR